MMKYRSRHIIILLICTILVLWNFNVYSADADNVKNNEKKDVTINLINFSEEDYLEYIFPLLPSHGYIFNRNYLHGNNILNQAMGTINFYESKNTIENKDFYRLEFNAFDKNQNPFAIEWDISKGCFFDNRKTEAFKFTTGMIFDSEYNDINAVFAKRLIESSSIINLNPLYSMNNETKNINGYEFNYAMRRSSTYLALRTSIEILASCSLGVINYFVTREVNAADWQYRYTWHDAKYKFIDGWYWDPNNFNTNTIYHLYAGATYYMIGRSNYYSIPESFLWSFGGSLMWEYFGEWREQVSLNDMIFTPTLGSLTGEFFIQSANFIERNMKPGFLREALMLILYPFGSINRWIDSSNSGDMRVRILFANPIQTAIEHKVANDVFGR
ncbi:MAG: DUF3943 domain-containing protein [Leptospirales bacterium]|nr:DUF3943 domain-containing protein [Leptospirales bacterium]